MKRALAIASGFALWAALACAQAPEFSATLAQSEASALRHSPAVQAAKHDWRAAEKRGGAAKSRLGPRLSFDASDRYVSEVATFKPLPNGPSVALGDHNNYSIGPTLSWTIWSSGALYNNWKSQDALARAKAEDYAAARIRLIQQTRLAYFQVQLALEQVQLLADSVKLAEAQYKDISLQQRAGTLSRIDSLSAHQEVLARRREFRQAQTDLAGALRELTALTGVGDELDVSLPLSERAARDASLKVDTPTVVVALDSLENSRLRLAPAADCAPSRSHPSVQRFRELVRSAERAAASLRAGYFPSIQLSARTSRDYPNGPVLEPFTQNTLGASLSWPLFEWGRQAREVAEQKETAVAGEDRRAQAEIDLFKDWRKAQDEYKGLIAEQALGRELVQESEALARMVYESYRAGRSTFLEVQNANLRSLSAKTALASTEVQTLIQLAVLDSLSPRPEAVPKE